MGRIQCNLLGCIEFALKTGRRNQVLLQLLYIAGLRVSEIAARLPGNR